MHCKTGHFRVRNRPFRTAKRAETQVKDYANAYSYVFYKNPSQAMKRYYTPTAITARRQQPLICQDKIRRRKPVPPAPCIM